MKKQLLLLMLMLLPMVAYAVNVEIDGIRYNIDLKSGAVEVTTNPFKAYTDTIVIPEKITYEDKEYQVTSIGRVAFMNCSVLLVSLPNSISSIGQAAFAHSSLDSIAIPEKVTYIDADVFADCQSLRRVILPDGITEISSAAFNCCSSLDSLVLPNTVEYIGVAAFAYCKNLSCINIPTSLKEVDRDAFGNCPSLMDVYIYNLSGWCMINFDNRQANPLEYSHKLVVNDEEIADLVIPKEVTYIGNYTFTPCWNITSLTIGDKVTHIGEWAFYGCNKMSSVTSYPRKVPSLGRNAFSKYNKENTTLYVAGSAVGDYEKSDDWGDFIEIVGLDIAKHQLSYYVDEKLYKSYTLEEGEYITAEPEPTKEDYTFSGWSEIPDIMPSHDVIVKGTFTLTSQRIQSDNIFFTLWVSSKTAEVSGIESNTFSGQLSIPATVSKDGTEYDVTSIGNSAFAGCANLTSVKIPESVTQIGKEAFVDCMLQNVFANNAKMQLEDNSFSSNTYTHAMLYIPTGTWSDAVYQGGLGRFINIRETATEAEELSDAQAYTLMNAKTFGYIVYDAVNDEVKTISSFYNIDESSPNNSWQIVNVDGENYLYNIGAKKFVIMNTDGKITLSETPKPLNMENKGDGIVFGNDTQTLWNFVLNNKVSVDQNVLGIEPLVNHTQEDVSGYYLLNGMRISSPRKGISIMKMSDGKTKKVLMK